MAKNILILLVLCTFQIGCVCQMFVVAKANSTLNLVEEENLHKFELKHVDTDLSALCFMDFTIPILNMFANKCQHTTKNTINSYNVIVVPPPEI